MPPLANGLRNDLENVVKKARVIAERGAKSALEALTVHEAKSGGHLNAAGRELRARLRAHSKQLGDLSKPNGEQAIGRLIRECAYEHWHRMLFARFLAENDLLIHPEHNVSVSLDDVQELAREQKVDPWELASRFATRMLPQIFRPDDPVLAVALPRERTLELEQLLETLPAETFKADDSLGWVYQFWQTAENERVRDGLKAGDKITGETLPAVTQFFTEHYMVLFLLHNTIGAWWAGKRFADPVTKNRVDAAKADSEVRAIVNLPDYQFEYLRFVRESRDGDEDGKPTGPWRPAAGTFDGWPLAAKDLKLLDPCCGSGHFLVAALELLARLRMVEGGLSLNDSIRAVLADNLFGIELDARCTQIAAFNLALAAWRMLGRPVELPALNIACCGVAPHATEDDWLRLAETSGVPIPSLGREPIQRGMLNLYDTFAKAPTLGSLIDPHASANRQGFAADYETLQPFLAAAFSGERADVEVRERAVAAQGMAKAAELLVGEYTLVITNVPYLKGGDHGAVLKDYCEQNYKASKYDLATVTYERCMDFLAPHGATALVTQQYWLFLKYYEGLRQHVLQSFELAFVARLGPGAFETISGDVVNVCLQVTRNTRPHRSYVHAGLELENVRGVHEKMRLLLSASVSRIEQRRQLDNPDHRISFEAASDHDGLLSEIADFGKGSVSGDGPHYLRNFWEIGKLLVGHKRWLNSPSGNELWTGREHVILWGIGDHNPETESGFRHHGQRVFGKRGVAIGKAGRLRFTPYAGELFDDNIAVVCPYRDDDLEVVWQFCNSPQFVSELRRLDKKMSVTAGTFTKVACSPSRWTTVEQTDDIREPHSDDPTQWLFHGRPKESTSPLHVAAARLLGYRWPAEFDEAIQLGDRARTLVSRCEELGQFADDDGVVCLPAVRGEQPAADRLAALLTACEIKPDRDLDTWLREDFLAEHCKLFHDRPFIWHIWDGRKDGFHALVNYHRLASPGDGGRKLLESLTHSYLGDWIRDQKDQVGDGKPGAEARLTAALDLKVELEKILAGEPPYDIFVRWKPLREQSIGWEPDINDGVRLNIRPFLMAKDVGRKGAGVLRCKPKIKWDKDRGKEPQSLRPKAEFPWFWGCDPEKHPAHRTNFAGGAEFDGNRWNDLHYTNAFKQAARDSQRKEQT